MAQENTFHFPKPGQRIIRSVIAVACCFCVFYLRNKEGIPFYSALAVLQCIQPYQDSMAQVARKRVTGTFVGAFWGLMIILIQMYLFHGSLMDTFPGYILISLFTGLVIYSTVVLNCKNTAYFSCVVFLSITVMHMTDANPFLFVFNRILDTLIGVGIALCVNTIHLPRIHQNDILFVSGIDDTLLNSNDQMSSYSKIELNRLIASGAKFTVSTNRTPATIRESSQTWAYEYRITYHDSARYPGCANIKIYNKDATRENMLLNLKALLSLDKMITFGSGEGKYDVCVADSGKDEMVKTLKKLYEPVGLPKSCTDH